MDEMREEVLRLKREELKARLKGLPSPLSEEEKSALEKWKTEVTISTDNPTIIIPPLTGTVKLAECVSDDAQQENFLDTKEETIVLSSQDILKKKRDELRQKGILRFDEQINIPSGIFVEKKVQQQWILNETVKVLFDNESLMKVYQSFNIPDESGQNIEDFDDILKQRREELRKRLRLKGAFASECEKDY